MAFDMQFAGSFPALKIREREPRNEGRAATKTRILMATEKLFVVHGFDATSLRAITTEAGVNLAAVNYHFGSKEELFALVLTNRLDTLNLERVRLLDALETADGKVLDSAHAVEQLITAMFLPALQLARNPERGGDAFLRFLGRAYADPSPFVRDLLAERYAAQNARFVHAFAKALPELTAQDLSMRLHFMLDAISSTLASEDARKLMTALALSTSASKDAVDEDAAVLGHLAPFLAGSLRAKVNQSTQLRAIRAVIAIS